MVQWMAEKGMRDEYLESVDFTQLGYGTITPEMLERMVPPIENFVLSLTKQELFEGAVERRILLFPVSTPSDIVVNPQLQARRYFQEVTHPDFDRPVTFLGPFVGSSTAPLQMRRLPPKIGEHNMDIYRDELGLRYEELVQLRETGVI
jgi:crotonobetainyl-CoA:carnitine CoA-transferase CaiB-like acyl-CoA transferase